MLADERQARIEDYLQRQEFASLDELAREVDASVSTVRRDVAQLAEGGLIRRTHGGARLAQPKSDEYVFSIRNLQQSAEKDAIGRLCAEMIKPSQTVILDAGSTVMHAAQFLTTKPLQIITNSLPVANLFSSSSSCEVVVSGGVIYPRLGVLVGPQAVETFGRVHADVAIMSASGITSEGIFNSHGLLIDMQLAMLSAAQKIFFCLDHTKFGRRSMFRLCDAKRAGTVISDPRADSRTIRALRKQGIEIVIANAPASMLDA